MIRALLALFLLLAWSAPAHAAIAYVQQVRCSLGGGSSCTTAAITTTSGNLVVASHGFAGGSGITSSDSQTNTWATAVSGGSVGVTAVVQTYAKNITGGASHTFTVTTVDTDIYVWLVAIEISGADPTAPFDRAQASSDSSVSSHTSGSTATTTQAAEMLIGVGTIASVDTFTTDTGAGWTEVFNDPQEGASPYQGILVGRRTVSATGAYAYTYTTGTTTSAGSAISTWKEASAAAGTRQRCVGCGADGKVIE